MAARFETERCHCSQISIDHTTSVEYKRLVLVAPAEKFLIHQEEKTSIV